jgi:predicted nucleic acid-binding protein
LRLPEEARTVSQSFQAIVPTVLPVTLADIVRARKLSVAYPKVAARDLIHVAVMLNNGLTRILSVDGHFDTIKEIVRLSPEAFVANWNQERAATATTSGGQND